MIKSIIYTIFFLSLIDIANSQEIGNIVTDRPDQTLCVFAPSREFIAFSHFTITFQYTWNVFSTPIELL